MPNVSPLMIGGLLIIALAVLLAAAFIKNYVKVPPNEVAVFTGWGKQKVIRGGARFKIPGFQRVDIMLLEPFSVQVEVRGVISKDGVGVNVDGVGLIKFGSTDEAIATAVERFLTSDRNELHRQVQEILAGNMRGIVAQMTIEMLNNNREDFRRQVVDEAGSDFNKIGMELDVLTIQNISDPSGYLEALGRKRIAEVKRDAEIGEAEARRDATVASAAAQQAGDIAQAEADTAIAQANELRDTELAKIDARVKAEQARSAQAGPLADAEARRAVVVAESEAERAKEEAQIGVEQMRGQRAEQAQRASVIIPAEAAKQAAVITAEGEKQASIARAEADAEAARLEGAAAADVRKTNAAAEQAEMEAHAQGAKAGALAEAEGIEAKLLAEAKGRTELAEALSKYGNEAMRLDMLPKIIERLPEIARELASPLGNIDSMVVLDSGNGTGAGGITNQIPMMLAQLMTVSKAMGIDIPGMLGNDHDAANGSAKEVAPAATAAATAAADEA